MFSMALIMFATNHGATPGAWVTACKPREQFAPSTTDAASGV
jgi:hypothetical protein